MLLATTSATAVLKDGTMVPFEQAPYANSWALGLSGNGVVDTATFIDTARGRSLTKAGGVTYDSTVTKFNPYSIKFDGVAGTYLQTPSSLNYAFSFPNTLSNRRDFAVSFWVYPTTQSGAAPTIITNSTTTSFATNQWAIRYSDSTAGANTFSYWQGSSSTTAVRMKTRAIYTPNQWHHVSLVRNRRFLYLFVNGVMECTFTATASDAVRALDSGAAQTLRIGSAGATGSAFAGFLDDLIIDRGSYDLIQSSPTQDYDLVSDPKLSQVALAYTFSGADGLTSLNPEIGPATVSFGAATNISTADSLFGGSSLYVGLPSPLSSTSGVRSGAIALGTNDFYIEAWVKPTALAATNGSQTIFDTRTSTTGTGPMLVIDDNGTLLTAATNNVFSSPAVTITPGSWMHVAFARESNGAGAVAYRTYLNGRMISEHTDYTLVNFGTVNFGIGGSIVNIGNLTGVGNYRPFLGYIDSFRVTVGTGCNRLPIYNPPTSSRPLLKI